MKYLPLSVAISFAVSTYTVASPWITTEESTLKHSIDLLVSHGVINRPVNQYPLLWQGLVQDLAIIDESTLNPQALFSLQHIKHALQQAKREQYSSAKAYYNGETKLANGFGTQQRAQSGINSYSVITGSNVSAKVQVNYADKANDEKQVNHYGSHLAILYGNWSLSAERLNYWWGPTNDNALLLSNNASPMKAIRLSRANSNYDGPSFLSAIGPWQVTAIAAKQQPSLTDKKEGAFWGVRLSSTPLPGLEIALSKTYSEFVFSTVTSNDLTEKVKQRISSIDFKYSGMVASQPLSFYAEIVGNNDSGITTKHNMFAVGLETHFGGTHYRTKAYIEYSDATTDCQGQQLSFQCHFASSNLGSDYKQRGQWLGAAIGPQSSSLTVAADYYQMSGIGGYAKLKRIDFEHINIKRTLIEAGYQQGLLGGLAKVGASVWQDDTNGSDNDTDQAIHFSWEFQF